MKITMTTLKNDLFGAMTAFADETGMVWFRANDVTSALGLERQQLRRVDDEDKRMEKVQSATGRRSTAFINEPGLYTLVLSSRKPEAKVFKHWVTHEVLPSIRKNGGYIEGQEHLGEEERKELEGKIRDLSAQVEKANAGKAKLQSYLIETEDRYFASADRVRALSLKVKDLMDMIKSFADPEKVERYLAALKYCREQEAKRAEIRRAETERAEMLERIYAKPIAYDPNPMVVGPDGFLCRQDEALGMDKRR